MYIENPKNPVVPFVLKIRNKPQSHNSFLVIESLSDLDSVENFLKIAYESTIKNYPLVQNILTKEIKLIHDNFEKINSDYNSKSFWQKIISKKPNLTQYLLEKTKTKVNELGLDNIKDLQTQILLKIDEINQLKKKFPDSNYHIDLDLINQCKSWVKISLTPSLN